jgi:hypothetical protein
VWLFSSFRERSKSPAKNKRFPRMKRYFMLGDRVDGVSGTSTRGGSGVLSMTMSGDILNGDGRSQYTGVNVFPGDSGGVVNWIASLGRVALCV